MIKNFSKVRIINIIDRQMEGQVIKKLLERKKENVEISIALDTQRWGAWKTYKMAMDIEDESDYLILMEDDLSFPLDVLQRMDHVLNHAPKDAFVFFYVPTNTNTIEAHENGKHVLKSIYNFWTQVTAIPKKHRENLLNTIDSFWPPESDSGDGRIKKYMDYYDCEAYTILPSMFQHLGTWRSSLGYNGKVGKYVRNSFCYDPSFDVKEIDWENEFKNPFKDKMGRGLIGFDGWQKGDSLDNYNLTNGIRKK